MRRVPLGARWPRIASPRSASTSVGSRSSTAANDAICAEEKAKGIVRTGTGIRSGLCSDYNLKKNEGVRSRVPLKDPTGSVVELRYK